MKCGGVTSVTFEQYSEARCGSARARPLEDFDRSRCLVCYQGFDYDLLKSELPLRRSHTKPPLMCETLVYQQKQRNMFYSV